MFAKLTLAAGLLAAATAFAPVAATAAPLSPQAGVEADASLVQQTHYRRHRHRRHYHYRHCRRVCHGHLHYSRRHGHMHCHGHWHYRCHWH